MERKLKERKYPMVENCYNKFYYAIKCKSEQIIKNTLNDFISERWRVRH